MSIKALLSLYDGHRPFKAPLPWLWADQDPIQSIVITYALAWKSFFIIGAEDISIIPINDRINFAGLV